MKLSRFFHLCRFPSSFVLLCNLCSRFKAMELFVPNFMATFSLCKMINDLFLPVYDEPVIACAFDGEIEAKEEVMAAL